MSNQVHFGRKQVRFFISSIAESLLLWLESDLVRSVPVHLKIVCKSKIYIFKSAKAFSDLAGQL